MLSSVNVSLIFSYILSYSFCWHHHYFIPLHAFFPANISSFPQTLIPNYSQNDLFKMKIWLVSSLLKTLRLPIAPKMHPKILTLTSNSLYLLCLSVVPAARNALFLPIPFPSLLLDLSLGKPSLNCLPFFQFKSLVSTVIQLCSFTSGTTRQSSMRERSLFTEFL